ncbi:MAG: helix-turn-helix domain-containing protein [Firmicutes bacterium]|nr:helix-turn-helix domain-containing protein [Bacillota bacterium]
MRIFGERITELRQDRGLTQRQMADVFNISQSTIALWETGKTEPNFEMLKKLANYFGVSADYLIGVKDHP